MVARDPSKIEEARVLGINVQGLWYYWILYNSERFLDIYLGVGLAVVVKIVI